MNANEREWKSGVTRCSVVVALGLLFACVGFVPLISDVRAAEPKAEIRIGAAAERSRVPLPMAQGNWIAPQSVAAVDISDDGRRIGVATMAFSHDRNLWVMSADGKIVSSRYVFPWAPFQIKVLGDGETCGVGMACSMHTDAMPAIVISSPPDADGKPRDLLLNDTTARTSPTCFLRYGSGDWRTGWPVSIVGDMLTGLGNNVLTVPAQLRTDPVAAMRFSADGSREMLPPLGNVRPFSIGASRDGRFVVCGYLVADLAALEKVAQINDAEEDRPEDPARINGELQEKFRLSSDLVHVFDLQSGKEWNAKPLPKKYPIPMLPEPADEFPELARDFPYMQALAPVRFQIAASVAVSDDGSRVAIADYAGWLRTQRAQTTSNWNPSPPHIPFCPQQRGVLRVFDASGMESRGSSLPEEGLFDIQLSADCKKVWCVPKSWFARGSAGAAWLPTDFPAAKVFVFDVASRQWIIWQFPDAVSDLAIHPNGDRILVSCWDGHAYLKRDDGALVNKIDVGGPARVTWSGNGEFAILGTADGDVCRLDAEGALVWKTELPVAAPPVVEKPWKPVFEEVPAVFKIGRVGPEHGYVGDIYLIKAPQGGILVDGSGGTSGFGVLWERIKAAGLEPSDVRYLLRTHSHGDHAGASYLWRSAGVKIVAPRVAEFTTNWMMPVYSHYGIFPPCPVDVALPLLRAGDKIEITLCGLPITAILMPGHSIDTTVYAMELERGVRVVFTGDIAHADGGRSNIYDRCWNDAARARAALDLWRDKVLPFKPQFVFAGHAQYRDGEVIVEQMLRDGEAALKKASEK